MKFNIKPLFFTLIAVLLSGCQLAGTSTIVKGQADIDLSQKEESLNHSVETTKNETSSHDATVESLSIVDEQTNTIGDEQTLNGLTLTIMNVREITVDYIKANKAKFIGVELTVSNNSKEAVEISSLPQISLFANNEPQDIALIETKGDIDQTIKPGESITGEIAFDSALAENYSFYFKNTETEELLLWQFNEADIKAVKKSKKKK